MLKLAPALVALVLAGCVSESSRAPAPVPGKPARAEMICRAYGLVPGTQEYTQCVTLTMVNEMDREDERAEWDARRDRWQRDERQRREERETIGEGMAIEICDRYARSRIPHPIKRRVTERASGGYEKTVTLGYTLDRTAEDPNVVYAYANKTCVLRGREVVDFRDN